MHQTKTLGGGGVGVLCKSGGDENRPDLKCF